MVTGRRLIGSASIALVALAISIAVGLLQNTVPVVLLPTFFLTSLLLLGGPDGTDWPLFWIVVFVVLTEVSWTAVLLGLWRVIDARRRTRQSHLRTEGGDP